MKLYYPKEHRIIYSPDIDIYFDLRREHDQLLDVLAAERLDGHNRYTQWMMKLEIKYQELLNTLDESGEFLDIPAVNDMLTKSEIIEQ
jgi:hypothetical protein